MSTLDEERQNRQREWEEWKARVDERLRRTDEIQKSWKRQPTTLIDAARALCDVDAPPPMTEELIWLKEKLSEHQQSVEKLILLIETLLDASGGIHHLDGQNSDRTFEEE